MAGLLTSRLDLKVDQAPPETTQNLDGLAQKVAESVGPDKLRTHGIPASLDSFAGLALQDDKFQRGSPLTHPAPAATKLASMVSDCDWATKASTPVRLEHWMRRSGPSTPSFHPRGPATLPACGGEERVQRTTGARTRFS